MNVLAIVMIFVLILGCVGENMKNETTVIGIYSERYKGGPVLETDKGVIYLVGLENSEYEGKTLEVKGNITQDSEHVVGPYKEGEPISQGWAEPRTMMNVTSFKIVK